MDLKDKMQEAIFEYETTGFLQANKRHFENAAIACAEIAQIEIESAEKKEAIGFAEWLKVWMVIKTDENGVSMWQDLCGKLHTSEQLFPLYKPKSNNG